MKLTFETYNGKKLNLYSVSNQHLSNIVHYCRYIGISPLYLKHADEIEQLVEERLDGKLLPYRPPVDNLREMFDLKSKKLLRKEAQTIMIIHEGNYIGEVVNNNPENFQILINALN